MRIKQHIKITTHPHLVEDYIKKEHLTQAKFAERCGVSPSYICKILSGQTRYRTHTLLKVLDVVGVSFEEFFDVEFLF